MSQEQKPTFEGWAIVEQMGHNRYAGRISEFQIGGAALIRIEVPAIPERRHKIKQDWDPQTGDYYTDGPREVESVIPARQAFTKLIGVQSIFAITPCTEEVARAAAEQMRAEPVTCIQIPERLMIPASTEDNSRDPEGDDPEDKIYGDPEGQF